MVRANKVTGHLFVYVMFILHIHAAIYLNYLTGNVA